MTDKTKLAAARDDMQMAIDHWEAGENYVCFEDTTQTIMALLDQAIGEETHANNDIEIIKEAMDAGSHELTAKDYTRAEEAILRISRALAHPPEVDWIEGMRREINVPSKDGHECFLDGWNAALDAVKEGMK